ncbi:hypothetical protein [Kamptonema sp. UHCC 0994]|uniref:hypothetical protein n=1 Tax=Kamptonema sp. UHCC 0994 TaxID=3031329 RepID=UPI0023BA1EB4|nr:hypothetical protein [Kamptonema sp. UHCC 0994]MDF0555919.1 hypothetical protein [Kamptonema sp. UHCC 0994]
MREIESALRDVLEPLAKPVVSNPNLSKCPSCGDKFSQSNQAPSHKDEISAILQALGIPETETVAKTWLKLAGRQNEYGLHGRAHRNDLAPPRPLDERFKQFWSEIQTVLYIILDKFETRYSRVYILLNELLSKPEPTKDDLKNLRLNVPNSFVAMSYFFERLSFPGWIDKLRDKGFFKSPPDPEVDTDTGRILFRQWPQSRYLARMASQEPAIVLEIALEILETRTKNVFVHNDLAEAALAMPPALAARWVEQEIEWLKKQDYLYFYLDKKLGKLVTYLTEKNQVNVALALIRELLAILPSSESSILLPEPNARLNDYEYSQILENHVPKLLEVAEECTFEMLCCLLDDAVRLSPSQDYSHNWRAAIEDNPHEIRERLISAVRDAAEQHLGKNPAAVCTLVPILESYEWTIFQRLALYLLYRFPNEAQNLIAERLTNRDRFQNQGELYEYKLLLRDQFLHLIPEAQQVILDLIAGGPIDRPISEDQRTAYKKHWQLNWLAILSDNLPTEWQQQYEQLVKEIGCPQPLEPTKGIQVWQGPNSPKSTTELASMSMEELFAFLREWQPSGNLFEPSRNDLGCVLSIVIVQKSEGFLAHIEQFKQLDWEYMVWLLRGLQSSLSSRSEVQQKFFWSQVFEFSFWMLSRLQDIRESSTEPGSGFNQWSRICEAVIDLLRSGLTPIGNKEIPVEFRNQVWNILEPLTNDSKLTPGFETYYHGSNASPTNDSVHTVRGKAMHAVIEYALWVKRYTQANENQEKQIKFSLDKVPEVREVIERHLNPAHDPSLVIRSVYGRCFSTLLLALDSGWTTKNQQKIFPTDDGLQELRKAAWEGYITSNDACVTLFTMLRKEYSHAIEQIGDAIQEWQNSSRADEALASHLLNLYWHGDLELSEPDKLLERFLAKASAQLSGEFMREIGERLRYGNFEIGVDLLQRLQRLWECRVSQVKSAKENNAQASDLKFFSWWFNSGKFDSNWALAQLKDVIRLVKDIDYDNHLLNHLVALAPLMPLSVVECLSLMVDELRSGDGSLSYYQEDSRTILLTALQSGDKTSHTLAEDLINRLLARGIADFRDLLTNMDN